MTFTVETGSGVVGANSYVTVADATAYLTAYEPGSIDSWPTVQAEQEAALIMGCQALELNYRSKFIGVKLLAASNELSFPRFPFYDRFGMLVDSTTIPNCIKQAQATLALYYVLGEDLFPQASRDSSVSSESVTIGDLSTSTSYAKSTEYDPFRKISMLLAGILRDQNTTSIVR